MDASRGAVEGDWISTLAGGWVVVEELYDTGIYEEVYNLRVAEDHTYFVGDETWAFGVWAHNTYYQQVTATPITGLPQAVLAVISVAASARAAREEQVNGEHVLGSNIPTRFSGNFFVVQAVTSSGIQTHVTFGTSPSSNHSEVQMLAWFKAAGVTKVLAAFSEHVPCRNCLLGPIPGMEAIAGNFTIYWGATIGTNDTASNQRLMNWWQASGMYSGQ